MLINFSRAEKLWKCQYIFINKGDTGEKNKVDESKKIYHSWNVVLKMKNF